ncbi:aldose epimerase family protein [Tabrizicola sp.]|uniref:aldose epimerase family protein n=1 Tax=Tabrizicola sp. TaxID=2005166 RepID=UPI003F2ACAB2
MTRLDDLAGAKPEVVGQVAGTPVHQVRLTSPDGAVADVLTWGAVIRDLRIPRPEGLQGVVLGFRDFADYPANSPYFGAVVGRYANRIANGRYVYNGQTHQLDRNEGTATLHGGRLGLSQRVWSIAEQTAESVLLHIVSPDGDQGFPGTLQVWCRYTLQPGPVLTVDFSATTDQPAPVNLSQHSYFALDDLVDLSAHDLQVFAESYTPVDDRLIPTGEVRPVRGTPYDFRTARPLDPAAALDINYVLSAKADAGGLRPAARLQSRQSGLTLDVATTKPGLQVYNGHLLNDPGPGLHGKRYGPVSGLCLETQHFPDSPNQPGFPDTILLPDQTYQHRTVFAFS